MVLRKSALKPATHPVCSVCVANYNGLETLYACLDSVLVQDCGSEIEIIVHDDASTDGSVDRLQEHYPGVELLLSESNVGFCISNNRMVEAARGEYVLLLNNDAVLWPDALSCLLRRARAMDRPAILGLPQYDMGSGRLIDRGSLLDPFFNPVPNLDVARTEVAMVIGACLWLPRQLWHTLGGFPEWFGSIAEDMYLCCNARLQGYPVEVLGESGYRHWSGRSFGGGKVTETGLRTTRRRRALSERNKTFVMAVCVPAPIILCLLPLHLLLLAMEGALLAILKWDMSLWRDIYWSCFVEIVRRRRMLLDSRVGVQMKRHLSLRDFLKVYRIAPYKLAMLARHGLPTVE